MATITGIIGTFEEKKFPEGTVKGNYRFTLTRLADGFAVKQETTEAFAVFTEVSTPGDYELDVLLLGADGVELSIKVTATVNVPVPPPVEVAIQVPASITVNLG